MIAPLRPVADAGRVELLRQYAVLDTSPERALDDLASLAAHICQTPIALISLIDAERQWFKARIGFPVSETSRDESFCGHTILEPDLFIVMDAADDERFIANPFVTGAPHVRFYAGSPLFAGDGIALGALCVMDTTPRLLSAAQQEALRVLSRQVMDQMELRRQARELADSESRLLKVFRTCPAALAINRWSDRRFVDVNEAFTELVGWPRDQVIGRTSSELSLVNADGVAHLRARLEDTGVLRGHELTVRTRTGRELQTLVGTERLELRGEEHVITTFVDITARKLVEVASNRLAAIIESSDDAIIGKDLNGVVTSWNKGAEAIFGYTANEMIGISIMRLIPPDRHDEETHILATVGRGQGVTHLETLRTTKSGTLIDVSVTSSPIKDGTGGIVGISKIVRDITPRRRAEEARRISDERYHALFDYAPDGIIIAGADHRYVDANASVCRMLGYTREELVHMSASDILVPDELAHRDSAVPAVPAGTTKTEYSREWRFRRRDGSVFSAEVVGTLLPDGNMLEMMRETTERNRNDARFRRLAESNVQGVMFWNSNGVVTGANKAFLTIIGYTRADLESGRIVWTELTPAEYDAADKRSLAALAATGVGAPYEKEYFRKDGSRVSVLVGAAAFEDNPDEGVCFVLDLTERKKLEQQFFRAQRMESIGTLAGGIAHDLNNVLAPILLSVALLKAETKDESLWSLLDTVQGCAQRGAELVQQVLTFARGVEGQRVVIDPVPLVRDLLKVMRDTFPKSIDIRFEPSGDVWNVTGDPTQLHQVFLNLTVNARDAMAQGGRLAVRIENVTLDETYATMNIGARPIHYVVVTVSDTGVGIPPDVRDRIFEPFFTTKEVGSGTGLGLSTTASIVKSHGGFVHVYSEVGQGTKFKVYLPANTTATADTASEQTELPRGSGELVLVVDDESAIRGITQATLERFGYRVAVANNGAEAVAVYAQRRAEIHVVLTDMAMPVMDGPAMIVALKAIDPAVTIIASSGLTSNEGVAKAVGAGVQHFVPKPYTAETLLKTLRLALTSHT